MKRCDIGPAVVTTILIADDHHVVRSGLRALLSDQSNWQVVADAANGKEAVEQAIATTPDVAIVDYALPILNGADVTRQIRKGSPATKVIIFAERDDSSVVQDVLRAGARGYLLKSDANHLLIAAVETVAAHKPFFTGVVSAALLRSFLAQGNADALTARERSVIQLVAEGHTNKEIASILNLGVKAVETHRAGAHHKLQLHSTAGLVRYAVATKWSQPSRCSALSLEMTRGCGPSTMARQCWCGRYSPSVQDQNNTLHITSAIGVMEYIDCPLSPAFPAS